MLGQCTLVDNPTPTTHTMCSGAALGPIDGSYNFDYADLDHTTVTVSGNALQSTFVDANLTDGQWIHVGLVSTDFTGATLDGISLYDSLETGAHFTTPTSPGPT